uniref:Copalyl diphosphate n=1 Tax=Scoparia dulcis TaxID=107240 RepID=Q9LRB1_SCODU|nr:copalyl diphosphate [Scoparia dulcis]
MALATFLRSPPSPGVFAAALHVPSSSTFGRTTTYVFPSYSWKTPVTSSNTSPCNAISRPRTEERIDLIRNGFPTINYWHEIVEDDTQLEITHRETAISSNKIWEMVKTIRGMLRSMEDGEITVSAYDTAWVALVEDIGGSGTPQFPSSLEWISNNQLPDGSWGDGATFSAHDRIINTLACVIALRTWNMHSDKSDRGIAFIRENMYKLEDENEEHMPIGFEVALPSLIEIAKKIDIDIPDESPIFEKRLRKKRFKLKRIPRDIMHKVPTTLLHSLEGMPALDWEKLINLQSADGSFLFSPSSTAFALQQTKDHNCLHYPARHLQKFNGGVPNVYPVDLFEHLWAVDRLERLGLSRYFQPEIEECIDYVHGHWTSKGICWARNSEVKDIDDTAMGFRLLKLHGYEVSADVFKHFENGGEFFCFVGQSTQAVTGMYNLFRASQVMFPGEDILSNAKSFLSKFLQEKRANNELLDKWIITKDLPGEVGYALDVPWYASLPRVETRLYLEQYGGQDDVWIGKTLYRMPYVNNNTYLELAKLDYNNCQASHQQEWKSIQKWYSRCNFGEYGMSERSLLLAYYIAAASIFEPERALERLAWAKTAILMETIETILKDNSSQESGNVLSSMNPNLMAAACMQTEQVAGITKQERLTETLVRASKPLLIGTRCWHTAGTSISNCIMGRKSGLRTCEERDVHSGQGDAELLVRTLNLCGGGGRWVSEELLLSHPKYQHLLEVTNRVCHQLRLFQRRQACDVNGGCMTDVGGILSAQIESNMQELAKLVPTKSSSGDLDSDTKQNFLTVARSFYYAVYCNPGSINFHIAKVLFERVL